jgi:hypothetical protein
MELDLGLGPRQVVDALERRRVAVLVARPSASPRVWRAAWRTRPARYRPAPGEAPPQAEDRIEHGPVVFESGRPSIIDIGVRIRGRGRETRPRSVSYCEPPVLVPSTDATWAAHTAAPRATAGVASPEAFELGDGFRLDEQVRERRVGRVGRRAPARSRRTTSPRSPRRAPRLVSVTRRISASSSARQHLERVVDAPSRALDLRAVLEERHLVGCPLDAARADAADQTAPLRGRARRRTCPSDRASRLPASA